MPNTDSQVDDKIACRTPTDGRDGVTRIPTWKFDLLRRAILHAVEAAGPDGLPFADLTQQVRARIPARDLDRLGSLGWHCTTVKLELEVAGEITRVTGVSPQRLMRANG